jgi:hypothetical protein
VWLTDLRPAFGELRFFFEDELEERYRRDETQRRSKGVSQPVSVG